MEFILLINVTADSLSIQDSLVLILRTPPDIHSETKQSDLQSEMPSYE